jgi:hypothetical protein
MKTLGRILICAWVLWGGPGLRLVAAIDGWESKAECEASERQHRMRDEAAKKSFYQCFPTGVDPRDR